jgi:hypothetical protein
MKTMLPALSISTLLACSGMAQAQAPVVPPPPGPTSPGTVNQDTQRMAPGMSPDTGMSGGSGMSAQAPSTQYPSTQYPSTQAPSTMQPGAGTAAPAGSSNSSTRAMRSQHQTTTESGGAGQSRQRMRTGGRDPESAMVEELNRRELERIERGP